MAHLQVLEQKNVAHLKGCATFRSQKEENQ